MSAQSTSASPHARTTKTRPFHSLSPDVGYLFDVRQGVPLIDALEAASCFLAAARNAAYTFAESRGDEDYGVAYLIDMAKAAVDASVEAAFAEERREVAP